MANLTYHEQKDITDKNKLFYYLKSKTLDFGVGSKKISKKVSNTFDKMLQKYQSKKDLKLDFFLYYASGKTLTEFLTDFEKSGMTTAETARLAYDKYINGCCPMDFEFYPINRCSYSTIFDGLDNVISGEKTLTREGLLLWLLFYYHKDDDGKEYFFQLDDINDFIGSRFLRLNDNYYFDKYVLTILGFTLDDHKIKYNGEEISDDNLLSKNNIHELRKSIIRQIFINQLFEYDYAAESFIGTNNSTTSLTFNSVRKRLDIK